MRILHLIDPAAAGGGPCTLGLVAAALSHSPQHCHDVLIIGTSAHLALAGRCGLVPLGRIGTPLNRPSLARNAIRKFLRAYESASNRYDLLHAWTPGCGALAASVAGDRRVLTGPVIAPSGGRAAPLEIRRLHRRRVQMLCASPAVRGVYEAAGLDSSRLAVLAPAVDRSVIAFADRLRLRARWAAQEKTFVVGLLGEPAHWVDARAAVNAVSRIALGPKEVTVVLHPDSAGRPIAQQWLASLAMPDRLVVDEKIAEPWRIVPGLDAALFMSTAMNTSPPAFNSRRRKPPGLLRALLSPSAGPSRLPSILPVLWAMAAGVPVIAETCEALYDIIVYGLSCLLFEPRDPNGDAHRIL
ncbi:MAG: hypothetical protein O7C65_05290 [Planctomycetota bacterium]|nr:hypothetical protein [Planctomycetota bacterium]